MKIPECSGATSMACGAVLADEALTALEVKDQELARANAALEGKSADVDRLSVDLKNQTDCVSKLMAEVRCFTQL